MKKAEPDMPEIDDNGKPEPLVPVELAPATPEQVEEWKSRAAKADDYWDRLLRTTADFDNFKKRATREKQEALKYASQSLMEKLVPILDNFDMALTAAQAGSPESAPSLQAGIAMIYQQFKNALAEAGLEEIDATNQLFDPNRHEAVSQKETGEVPEGQVVQQLRKGYKLRDRLVRPASVVVAKKPSGH